MPGFILIKRCPFDRSGDENFQSPLRIWPPQRRSKWKYHRYLSLRRRRRICRRVIVQPLGWNKPRKFNFKFELKRVLPKYPFRLSEKRFDKSKARFRRLQNSPLAQTIVIADLTLRRDLLVKTLSMAAPKWISFWWQQFVRLSMIYHHRAITLSE